MSYNVYIMYIYNVLLMNNFLRNSWSANCNIGKPKTLSVASGVYRKSPKNELLHSPQTPTAIKHRAALQLPSAISSMTFSKTVRVRDLSPNLTEASRDK